jgi:hypothetical protein
MNNRLHKLTDSLDSRLNYFSRRTGKPAKNKHYQGSPLLQEPPSNTLLLQSHRSSPEGTPHLRSHSHSAHHSPSSSLDSKEILIVDSPSSKEILILDQEEA